MIGGAESTVVVDTLRPCYEVRADASMLVLGPTFSIFAEHKCSGPKKPDPTEEKKDLWAIQRILAAPTTRMREWRIKVGLKPTGPLP